MEWIQAVLAVLFAIFAILTFVMQIQYGRECKKNEELHQKDSQAALKIRRRLVTCAVCAGIFLAADIIVGMIRLS